jgi:hypothetical protein
MSRKNDAVKAMTETFDLPFWSIATVLSAATVYLACLI